MNKAVYSKAPWGWERPLEIQDCKLSLMRELEQFPAVKYFHQKSSTKSSKLEKLLVASSNRAIPTGTAELKVKVKVQ